MESTPTVPAVTLRELVFVILKRKWSILIVLLVGMLCGMGWMFLIREDVYLVGAKVLIKLGREQAPPTSLIGLPPMVMGYRQQDVNSESDILRSTELVERVVNHFKLDQPGPPDPVPERLVARVRFYAKRFARDVKKWLNDRLVTVGLREPVSDHDVALFMVKQGLVVFPQKESNVIVVTMTLPFRAGSSKVLNKLLDEYLVYRQDIYRDQGGPQFFVERASQASAALEEVEKEMQALEKSSDIQALEKQKEILLQQLANAEEIGRVAQLASDEASDKLRRLKEEMEKPDPNFAAVGAFERESFATVLLTQLAELQRDRDKLRLTELEDSLRIANNRQQYNTMRDMLLANLRSAAEDRRAGAEKHAKAIAVLRGRLEALQAHQMNWTGLRRRVLGTEESYLFYKKKLDESSAQTALTERQVSNVAIVERAADPIGPTGMRKITLLGIIAASCLLAAMVWVAVAEYFDHRVYSARMLERTLGVPTMAVAPRLKRSVPRCAETVISLSELESYSRHAATA